MDPEAGFLLGEAHRLGLIFLDKAVTRADGSLFWQKAPAKPGEAPGTFGPFLYAGSIGCALFLAALGKATGEKVFGEASLKVLQPLRRQLRKLVQQPAGIEVRLGALDGVAGYVYTFLRIGNWLDQPELSAEAADITRLVTPERIAADPSADLMSGSAGTLLVLLRLAAEVPETSGGHPSFFELAGLCGNRLLDTKIGDIGDPGGWPNRVQPPASGLAHGASGIALALLQLARLTGRDELRAAALEGLAFDRLHYDPDVGNWWPVRFHKTPLMLNAWCSGAAGIALSRLRMLGDGVPEVVAEDLETALESLLRTPPVELDSVCCGNFGRVEALFEAHRRLDRPELLLEARRLATAAAVAAQGAVYRTNGSDFCPGFYTGLAGIGFTLLRLSGAGDLPCVVLLE